MESLLELLKHEDELIKRVKEAQDTGEFYTNRATDILCMNEYCDNETMHEVFEEDMQKCEMKVTVYREREMKLRKELKNVRKEIKNYISFIMSERFNEEEDGDICGF